MLGVCSTHRTNTHRALFAQVNTAGNKEIEKKTNPTEQTKELKLTPCLLVKSRIKNKYENVVERRRHN